MVPESGTNAVSPGLLKARAACNTFIGNRTATLRSRTWVSLTLWDLQFRRRDLWACVP